MSERGVFAVDRGIWDHPVLASREPFTRREAWLWLISEAAWKPRRRRVGSSSVELDRGEIAHSVRFIADAWGWPKSTVARFLDALKTETMIGTRTDQGVTIITICNYDEYQRVSLPDRDKNGTANGTEVGHERDTAGTAAGQQRDKLEDNKSIEDIETPSLRSGEGAGAPAKPKRATKARTQLPDDWSLDERDIGYAASRGFGEVQIEQMARAFANHHRGRGNLMADWHAAWRTWSDNEVKFNGAKNGRRTVQDAARDLHENLLERIAAFDEPPPRGLCDGTGEDALRLLPPGRRQ
jgi:hypothetical protein